MLNWFNNFQLTRAKATKRKGNSAMLLYTSFSLAIRSTLVQHKICGYYQCHQFNQTEKDRHQNAKNLTGLAYTRQYKCLHSSQKSLKTASFSAQETLKSTWCKLSQASSRTKDVYRNITKSHRNSRSTQGFA